MRRRAGLAALTLVVSACAGPAPPGGGAGAPVPADSGDGWVARVRPFPVQDSTGRDLELAFLGGLNLPRPQLADIDGDGKLDLVLQEFGGRLVLLAGRGPGSDGIPRFELRSNRYEGLDVGEWSRILDLDGDGDLDLLAEWPYSYIRLFRNDGSQGGRGGRPAFVAGSDTLRDAVGTAIFADRQNIPQIVDIDCNGRLDLFIGRITGHILRYEAEGANATTSPFRLLTDRWQDLEILTGQAGDADDADDAENTGGADFAEDAEKTPYGVREARGTLHGANTMAFADYDRDGDLDLFWGDFFEAGLLLFRNHGTCAEPVVRNEPVRFPPEDPVVTSGYNAPAFGDLDGDGRMDLVVGVLGGAYDPNRTTIVNLHYFAGADGGRFDRRSGQLLPVMDVGSESIPAIVDWDGDGDLDLLLANKIEVSDRKTSAVYWFENIGGARAPSLRLRGKLPFHGSYHFAPAFGDLDGDGDPDLLMGSFGARLAHYRNDGGGQFGLVDSALVEITRGSNTTPALGDLDGDGDLDLMIGETSGGLNFYRNEGTPKAARFVLVSEQLDSIDVGRRSAPVLVDLDGDGDLDLVIGSDDRGLLLYRNEGSRAEPRWVQDSGFRLDVPPIGAPAFGDLDGDGDLDLVLGNVGGGSVYFEQVPR
jgi:FG-GAP-like repeat